MQFTYRVQIDLAGSSVLFLVHPPKISGFPPVSLEKRMAQCQLVDSKSKESFKIPQESTLALALSGAAMVSSAVLWVSYDPPKNAWAIIAATAALAWGYNIRAVYGLYRRSQPE